MSDDVPRTRIYFDSDVDNANASDTLYVSVFPPEVSAGVSSPDGGLEESSVPSSSIAMGEHPERMLIRIIIRQLFVFICMVMDYGLEGSFAAGEGQVVNVALLCHLDARASA